MKYLNNFKENKDDYYIKNYGSSDIIIDSGVDISMHSQKYIKNLLMSVQGYQVNIKKSNYTSIYYMYILLINYQINIYELKDEYFIVNIDLFNDVNSIIDRYKCDQLDGIKELLEDLKII